MSDSSSISVDFLSEMSPFYLRNNRSTGQKSMRCFPSCCPKGHIHGGKCGTPLEILVNLKPSKQKEADLLFVAEIRPENKPRLSGMTAIRKGILDDQIRSLGNSRGEVFLGNSSVVTKDSLSVEFNSLYSWDYSWKSDRWTSNTLHVVDVIVLRSFSFLEYKVCSSHTSTPFKINCSHKKKSQTDCIKARIRSSTKPILDESERYLIDEDTLLIKRACFDYDMRQHIKSLMVKNKRLPLAIEDSSDSYDSEDDDLSSNDSLTKLTKIRRVEYSNELILLPECH